MHPLQLPWMALPQHADLSVMCVVWVSTSHSGLTSHERPQAYHPRCVSWPRH